MAKFDLVKLQEKVEEMVQGEGRRRKIALEYVEKVTDILEKTGPDLWGSGDAIEFPGAVFLTRVKKDGKIRATDIYFRYKSHAGESSVESPGFYSSWDTGFPLWGKPLDDLRGKEFWYAIQVVIEWIPQIVEEIETKSKGREKLLDLIER